jgi:hypothetical protein
VTLEYTSEASDKGRILQPKYRGGAFAGFGWTDWVARNQASLAATDLNNLDPSKYLTKATPIYVGVVRRVRNARGVNSSLEDDDDVQYVSQAKVLDEITLDQTPKVEYEIRGKTMAGADIDVRILPPGGPQGRQVVFLDRQEALKFIGALKNRIKSAGADIKNGLVWDEKQPDLEGYKIVWNTTDSEDWSLVNSASLFPSEYKLTADKPK